MFLILSEEPSASCTACDSHLVNIFFILLTTKPRLYISRVLFCFLSHKPMLESCKGWRNVFYELICLAIITDVHPSPLHTSPTSPFNI